MKRNLVIVGLLMISLCTAADIEAGKKMERTACVACHSLRIIESQRLSAVAWGKEIDKMVGWGAVVPDRQVLIDYLATEFSNTKPVPTPETSKRAVTH
jgi:hypothetical protein